MALSENPQVLKQREGAVVTLTINRPERLNAMSLALWKALVIILHLIFQDLEM